MQPLSLAQIEGNAPQLKDEPAPEFTPTPFSWPDPTGIKPRRLLCGNYFQRGEITSVTAPGATGKTTFLTTSTLALVSGRSLLGQQIHEGPVSVWYWNLEDDPAELDRQFAAAGLYYELGANECGRRLFVDGLDQSLCTAIETHAGLQIIEPVFDALKDAISSRNIDILIIDPFVSSHEISENDNGKINKVVKRWKKLAHETQAAIVLVHHTRKMGGREVRAEDSRGASSFIDAVRSALTLNRMSVEEAERFQITDDEERKSLIRIDNGKSNRTPAGKAWWMKIEDVDLGNGDAFGVGVGRLWTPPDPFDGLSTQDLYDVQLALDRNDYADSVMASDWAGNAVAEILGLDPADPQDKNRIKSLIRTWKTNGALKVEKRPTSKGREKPFLIVGNWIDPSTLPHLENRGGKSGKSGAAAHSEPHPTPLSLERGGGGGVGVPQ